MNNPAQSLEERVRRMFPVSAPPDQREDTAAVFRLLDRASHQPAGGCRIVGPDGQEILIPESMFYVFERVAEVLARGDAITVLPVGQELTTQQGADILNVSRQYLVRLLDQGTIPFTRTGTHRRVRVGDLLAYKQRRDNERAAALDALSEMTQAMGGYDEIPVVGSKRMVRATFRVVLDANVLFPFTLRDTLLRAAAAGYFQLYWSSELLEEARRNLVGRGVVDEVQAERLFSTMRRAFPEAEVSDYEAVVEGMPNEPKDRHVAAAAVKAGAQVIVTFNLKDFRELPEGIEAQSPSDFLEHLLDLDPTGVVALLRDQAAALTQPAKTLDQLLHGLEKTVPRFVQHVRLRVAVDE